MKLQRSVHCWRSTALRCPLPQQAGASAQMCTHSGAAMLEYVTHLSPRTTFQGDKGPMAALRPMPPPAALRWGLQGAAYQNHRGQRNPIHRRAALPADALGDALPAAAAAAAASSFLTAAWLRWAGAGSSTTDTPQDEASQDADAKAGTAAGAGAADAPASAEAVWAAAWQGFAPAPKRGPSPDRPAAHFGDAIGQTPPHGQQAGQQRQEGEQQPEAPSASEAGDLQRTPLLLLQGIRGAERARLLALCLAALEAQLSALPPGAAATLGGAAQWRQLATAMLALSSLAAAAAWLGYVPVQLLQAAAGKLAAVEPAVLRAAGLDGAAATLRRQVAALTALAGDGSGSGSSSADPAVEADVEWFGLAEKAQLYCSVLRLLSCAVIDSPQQQQRQRGAQWAAAGRSSGTQAAAPDALLPGELEQGRQGADFSTAEGASSSPVGNAELPASASSEAAGQTLARQQALALLRQQQQRGGPVGGIRGWRATAAGNHADSQLLSLAPLVLQDMAVTAADAVAAAYLADAADAGPDVAAAALTAGGPAAAAGELQHFGEEEGDMEAAVAGVAAAQQQDERRWRPSIAALWGMPAGTAGSGGRRRASEGGGAALDSGNSSAGSAGSGGGSGSPLEAGWWPTFVHAQLGSTRQLQRFTNAVALNRWVQRQYRGVADIYEDRLRLFRVTAGGTQLEPRAAPVKRTPELSQLKGLRYAASLLLEAADLLLPVLRTLWQQATSAASWLVVAAVGRVVALVRRGVQQGSAAATAAAAAASTSAASDPGRRQRQRQTRGQQRPGSQQPNEDGGEAGPRQQRPWRRGSTGLGSESSPPGWAW